MVFYAQTGLCRWRVLLTHLEGDEPQAPCATCDNCRRIAIHTAEAREVTDSEAPAESIDVKREFLPEAKVHVKRYGVGHVVSADALAIDIEFADGTTRSFHPDFVRPIRSAGVSRKPQPIC
jgi:ATP-dependent DNA helicase RecQ